MAVAFEIEVVIGRRPTEVFAHLTDVERWPEWLIASGIVRVVHGDDGRLTIDQRVAGRATTLDGRIVALEEPTRFALEGRDRDGVTVEIDATLVPDGPGTRLRWSLRLGLPLRYRAFESMVAPGARRAATLDLEAFRRRLESVAGD